ncbi:MAG: response regulator [Anaerolineaceae bacterium]|nr:MAG: response regulator [Anaerolineaceae bacterium]
MKRVMVIEDNPSIRAVYADLLHLAGCDVAVVETMDEASALYQKESFDVIISDVIVHVVGSDREQWSALLALWRDFRANGSHVIVVSGREELREEIESAGISFYIKPMSGSQLIELVMG